MCGIAGISLGNPKQLDSKALWKAANSIKHRGPDDIGVFLDEPNGVGLAHTRLSIQDLSTHGHQPMKSEDGKIILSFNGEIYNFKELRAELINDGYHFNGHSDTEVVLRLYISYKDKGTDPLEFVKRLNGIFGLAIWDASNEVLLLIRDPLGVKPVYFFRNHSTVAFSSEIKGLLPLVNKQKEINYDALYRYLTFLWCPGNATLFKSIEKLGPGEALRIRKGEIVERVQWYTLPHFRSEAILEDPEAEIQQTQNRLRTAIHRQLVSDVPVGAFLSGGLDSSAIVAFAREVNPDITCFTIDTGKETEAGIVSDLPYAKKVANYLNLPLEIIKVDSAQMASGIEEMVYQLDEPLGDPAPLNVLHISKLARDHGMKVLLSGAGGDDLFSGYRRHYALQLEKWWRWMPKTSRSLLDMASTKIPENSPLTRRIKKLFRGANLDGDERITNYFKWLPKDQILPLFSKDIRETLESKNAAEPMIDFLSPMPKQVKHFERMLALEQRFFLTDHNLTYTDKMAMAVGVEVRVPFLDLELVDYAASISSRLKQRGSCGKWILKKAMENYLPHDIIYRPKSGFGAPLVEWLSHDFKDLLSDLLSEESVNNRGIFDYQGIQALRHKSSSGRLDCSYVLLTLVCVEIWLRKFYD